MICVLIFFIKAYIVGTHLKYLRTLANSVDPDQTPQNAAYDLGLHCLH